MALLIKKLEESVINRIAAGEVIQRPANALKELVENSLDAGSTAINVTVKNGGLKLLQIQDNGSGIQREDMRIVCERFTTSKLVHFEDLSNINTYGFRGEALASISHVARVTITTKVADAKCAYKGIYSDGKLVPSRPGGPSDPTPCAGNQGTNITVEDLFYNVPIRLKALKNPSDEYRKIADMFGKYAIHNTGVMFTLKKHSDSVASIRTTATNSVQDNIATIYGLSVARELLSVSCEDKGRGFTMTGYITGANYSVKKLTLLLFINHRLVDSSSLRKVIETVYSNYLPKKTHPFIYLSIEIQANNVDVNVHPTKQEVHFLHEELIMDTIQGVLEERLLGCNASRTYYTQTLLPGAMAPVSLDDPITGRDNVRVRVDHTERKLDAFFVPTIQVGGAIEGGGAIDRGGASVEGVVSQGIQSKENIIKEGVVSEVGVVVKRKAPPTQVKQHHKKRRKINLTSVTNLLDRLYQRQHSDLQTIFREHKFIGCVDQTKALIQHQTKLYLINVTNVTRELFYQLTLLEFGNFPSINLTPPPSIYRLATIALDSPASGWTAEDGTKEGLAEYIVTFLKEKAEMLSDYYSLNIDGSGCVLSLPSLLEGFTPNMDALPIMLLRLVTEVDWEDEQKCFNGIATEYSQFCAVKYDPFLDDAHSDGAPPTSEDGDTPPNMDPQLMKQLPWRWTIEHVIFPAIKKDLIPPSSMAEDGTVLQLTDVKDLYKVFERC